MRIGVDIDGVLAPMVESFCLFLKDKGYEKKHSDFIAMNWGVVLGVDKETMVDLVYEFYGSSAFLSMTCIQDSQSILQELAKKHELFVISSRQRFIQKETQEWIEKFYPGIFKAVFVCDNHYDHRSEHPKEKADVCKEHGITLLIEDDPHHISYSLSNGVDILIVDQPWNQDTTGAPRVKTWKEIANFIEDL